MPCIRPVGDRRKPSRLGEANLVRRDSHAHFVPSTQQLTADSDAGLDIAASSIACQHKFHRGDRSRSAVVRVGSVRGIGHYPGFWITRRAFTNSLRLIVRCRFRLQRRSYVAATAITANDVQRLLDSSAIIDPAGGRDYAFLVMVARRACEAGALQLDDLDWCAADRIARQCIPRGRGAAARRCRRGVERLPVPGPLKRTASRHVQVRPCSSVWDIQPLCCSG